MDSIDLRQKTQLRRKNKETEEYFGTMDSHTKMRLAFKKCFTRILSYLVIFILEILDLYPRSEWNGAITICHLETLASV